MATFCKVALNGNNDFSFGLRLSCLCTYLISPRCWAAATLPCCRTYYWPQWDLQMTTGQVYNKFTFCAKRQTISEHKLSVINRDGKMWWELCCQVTVPLRDRAKHLSHTRGVTCNSKVAQQCFWTHPQPNTLQTTKTPHIPQHCL